MDDLISKKALIKELQELSTLEAISDRTGDMMFWVDKKAAYKIIENLPTIQPQRIDKDRLIEELEKKVELYYSMLGDGKYESFAEEFIKWFNQQPTLDGWVPVSKDKPKSIKPVLVTVHPPTFPEPYTSMDYITSYGDWKSYPNEYITAWQPLPSAYKESFDGE